MNSYVRKAHLKVLITLTRLTKLTLLPIKKAPEGAFFSLSFKSNKFMNNPNIRILGR